MLPIRHDLLQSASHLHFCQKVMAGFKEISGSDWQDKANYEDLWTLVHKLYAMANGEKAVLPEVLVPPLAYMAGAHAGRTRKGIRKRPYFHHILMALYVVWLLRMTIDVQLAAIAHDDVEDLANHLGISQALVEATTLALIGQVAFGHVKNHLTNTEGAVNKHKAQMAKISVMSLVLAIFKIVDRICNLCDLRLDKPKGYTPSRIKHECEMAFELAGNVKTGKLPDEVLALLSYVIKKLADENDLLIAEAA